MARVQVVLAMVPRCPGKELRGPMALRINHYRSRFQVSSQSLVLPTARRGSILISLRTDKTEYSTATRSVEIEEHMFEVAPDKLDRHGYKVSQSLREIDLGTCTHCLVYMVFIRVVIKSRLYLHEKKHRFLLLS